jgi:hypothetical protein
MGRATVIPGSIQGMIPGPGGALYPRDVNQRRWPPNEFNQCLDYEACLWQFINDCGGLQAICPGQKYASPPWVKMPAQGKRFSKINSIALPSNDGLDHQVLQFLVPQGYDGCIVGVVNLYTGSGFAEGSGDLTWRIRLNQRYVKDYGVITTTIGSLQIPYTVNAGQILLQANQNVQYFVNRSVGSGGNLNGGRIICGLFGWYWPR